jgi:y4mF family transcriptional regulator
MGTYAHTNEVAMRLNNVRDLGLYVRDSRRRLGLTQAELAASAQVSRRWLSDLESGKPTAEVGLVFKVLHALDMALDVSPVEFDPGDIDLDDLLRTRAQLDDEEAGRGR